MTHYANPASSTPLWRKAVKAALDQLAGDVWDDLRFPAQGVNPAGLSNPATPVTSESTWPAALSFSGTVDNICAGIAQMPHAWKRGSAVIPHIHWLKPTGSSSAVTWELYYRLSAPGQAAGAWQGPVSSTIVVGDQTVSDQQLISSFGSVSMTGYLESTILAWRLYRRGSTDAESNAVTLLEFDIHYQVDKNGTPTEIPS